MGRGRPRPGYREAGKLVVWSCLLLFTSFCMAQNGGNPKTGDAVFGSSAKPVSFLTSRFQFLTLEGDTRFRYLDKGPGNVGDRDLQYKLSTKVQINVTGDGATYIQARGESGRSFASSWDYMGVGLNQGFWSFNLKSLFAGQKIGKNFEAQAGSIEYDRGAGTEATYADNDGWLEGYRLRYTGTGRHWLPDKFSATIGYIGDFSQPNAFARLHRLGDENYVQLLASRNFGNNREVSAEFDSIQSVRYNRDAVHLKKLHLGLVDELTTEALIRASDNPSFGWSSSLYRTLDKKKRFRLGVFYSDMPRGIFLKGKTTLLQNGDSYALGKRIGPTVKFTPVKNVEISLFGSGRLDNTPGTRYRGQIAVQYQFAGLFNRAIH